MSDAFEDFLVIFEATTPALRSRVMDMILAEAESEPDPEADFDELATEAGISPGQRERIRRAVDEAFAYRAAQND